MFKGERLNIHGSFRSKVDAVKKERKVRGFIRRTRDRSGRVRYTVFSRRDRGKKRVARKRRR